MKLTLGTNIAALRAGRTLGESQNKLSSVFERLSSGQRINRASDDAAGLAIADSLRADARVQSAAIRNINDGVSLLNIMDATLSAQSDILTRLKELAEQSANGVYSSNQRDALNNEYQALVKEFGRIGDSTEFNGVKLLDDEKQFTLQVGTGSDANSAIAIETGNFGSLSGTLAGRGDYNGDFNVNFSDFGPFGASGNGLRTLEELFEIFGYNYQELSVQDSNGTERTVYALVGVAGYNDSGSPGDFPGTIAYYYEADNGRAYSAGFANLSTTLEPTTVLTFSQFAGSTAIVAQDLSGLQHLPASTYGEEIESAIDFSGVDTKGRALHALDVLEKRSEEVSTMRSKIGANQSRLGYALNVAQTTRENSLAAESRIRDADIAFEAAELVRLQILQQAGAAVLAQANQQPQLALQLLVGIR